MVADNHMRYRDECFAEQDKYIGKPDTLSEKKVTGQDKEVKRFEPKPQDNTNPSERMRQAIDSPKGRKLYSQRFGTVEPVFANIRNKRLTRCTHPGRAKVHTRWNLYCKVHNIEKLAKADWGRHKVQQVGNEAPEPLANTKQDKIAAHFGHECKTIEI